MTDWGRTSPGKAEELAACQRCETEYPVGVSAPDTIEIPRSVLESVETLDELEDWLMSHNPAVMKELRAARQEDQAGQFQPWQPRFAAWPTKSK